MIRHAVGSGSQQLALPGALRHAARVFTWLIRRRVTAAFDAAGRGDIRTLASGLAPHVHRRFAGDHALAGERFDRETVVAWASRLHRLFPEIEFDLGLITTAGFPWALTVTVEWRAQVTPAVGASYVNTGAHVIGLRGTRVIELHAYEDSQAVVAALAGMTAAGITEAAAPPITSTEVP